MQLLVTKHGSLKNYLPTTQLLPQVLELRVGERLGEDVRHLFQSADGKDLDSLVGHKLAEVMVLERDVLRSGGKFGSLCHLDAAPVIFPDLAEELRLDFRYWKEFSNFRHQIEEW